MRKDLAVLSVRVLWMIAIVLIRSPVEAKILYVDGTAAGASSGASWADAFPFLQDALNAAEAGDEIRMARGVYCPDQGESVTPGDRNSMFSIDRPLSIYGGYAGSGDADPNRRDPIWFETVLSGDLAGNDVVAGLAEDVPEDPRRAENAHTVVTVRFTRSLVSLDGLTITGGHNDSSKHGGGLFAAAAQLAVVNCTFRHNSAVEYGGAFSGERMELLTLEACRFELNTAKWGGALYTHTTHPTLRDCVFSNNSASGMGGGYYDLSGDAVLIDCVFEYNDSARGGAICITNESSPVFTACRFIGNTAEDFGGGMFNRGKGRQTLTGCEFKHNRATWYGGGMFNTFGSTAVIQRCLFVDNAVEHWGGALHFHDGTGLVSNCTIVQNRAEKGAAVACGFWEERLPSAVMVTNSILWNPGSAVYNDDRSFLSLAYCFAEEMPDASTGGRGRPGGTAANPLFVRTGDWDAEGLWVDGDYHLKSEFGRWDTLSQTWVRDDVTSPCIDAGNPGDSVDFEFQPHGGIINQGIYGGTSRASMSPE